MNKHLATVLDDLGKVPHINQGGCGISAYVILKYLKKHAPELYAKSQAVFTYDQWQTDEFETNTMYIDREITTHAESCHHILVKIGHFYYDSGGRRWRPSRRTHHVPTKGGFALRMLKLAINEASWNPMFERRNCHGISERLGLRLSELDYPSLEESPC